jgi:hypothetical protein
MKYILTIYYMNSKKGFALPAIIVIVALIAIGGSAYVYTQRSSNAPGAENSSKKVESPKVAYERMKVEFDAVTDFASLDAFMRKHSSQAQIAALDADKARLMSMSKEQRDQLVVLAKMVSPTSKEINVTSERLDGNTATLSVTSVRPGISGTVVLVLQNGAWKLESEAWNSSKY